jgi:hypothetical protein
MLSIKATFNDNREHELHDVGPETTLGFIKDLLDEIPMYGREVKQIILTITDDDT